MDVDTTFFGAPAGSTRIDGDRRLLAGRRYSRRSTLRAGAAGLAAAALFAAEHRVTRAQSATPTVASLVPDSGDFAGLVDIGGRKLYLEAHGTGSPTVVLVAGGGSSAHYWTDDLLHPDAPRTMVMPQVAEFARVYAYDRPGTYAPIGDDVLVGRSDPVAQPRTVTEMVDELHTLLQAAEVPGPYVLAGHSNGGFISRLYASTYPDEVIGLVLVDAFSELLEDVMPPERWQALVRLNQEMGSGEVRPIPGYGDAETTGYGAANGVMREAVAASPLAPMPLAVLAHGTPFAVPEGMEGFTSDELEGYLLAGNEAQAALLPNARFTVATESGHDIHQDQPELVVEAIRQVVAGVRNPDTWYDLTSCCEA
jgi:pimeloyl-ACP methyl ester carboxylesterase